ncbi:MAG: 4Fe-4S dicluster domain-containing protein [Cryobacterium sp.]|nr:4Fe-4S dicluster domain-containing protein [Oligoflexia bacterium]
MKNFYSTPFDVAIVAGNRLPHWPSVGVRELSKLCTKFGLEVGWVGGPGLRGRGVIPTGSTGGVVLAEDIQGRTHRIQARAIVRFSAPDESPSPFEGSSHPSLFLGATAMKLREKSAFIWNEPIAILGTGNRAFSFAIRLLEEGCPEVILIETFSAWEGKTYAGWEVERRRFEILGGRILEAEPLSFRKVGSAVGEFRVRDRKGIRVLEVSRIVSFGPFGLSEPLKEYPPESLLFDLLQTSSPQREKDPEGWMMEEERARILASKVARALVPELGSARVELEAIARRARSRMKRMEGFLADPFEFSFNGKWTASPVMKSVKAFSGVPSMLQAKAPVASIECFETIGCDLCERACPTTAIHLDRLRTRKNDEPPRPILDEAACIACGLCLQACPSATPVMLREPPELSMGSVTFSWRERETPPDVGKVVTLLNRRGETLGTGRVLALNSTEAAESKIDRKPVIPFSSLLVEVEVPNHLVWEARGIRKPRAHASAEDQEFISSNSREFLGERVEISWNGERRFVRSGIPISTAFFENGYQRTNDRLLCEDGSCGLCEVEVDGLKQLGCTTMVRRGMSIRSVRDETPADDLCPCLSIRGKDFVDRVEQGSLLSVESAMESTGLGSGRCHGQLCLSAAKRTLEATGLDPLETRRYIDWRFPSSDWKIDSGQI